MSKFKVKASKSLRTLRISICPQVKTIDFVKPTHLAKRRVRFVGLTPRSDIAVFSSLFVAADFVGIHGINGHPRIAILSGATRTLERSEGKNLVYLPTKAESLLEALGVLIAEDFGA